MGRIGFILLVAGTIGCAAWGAKIPIDVTWFSASMVVLLIGIALMQMAKKKAAAAIVATGGTLDEARQWLADILAEVSDLNSNKGDVEVSQIHERLDNLVTGPVFKFTEVRNAISDAYGLKGYAEVMGPFATGERFLNRCWSASTDGYPEEVKRNLSKAAPEFEAAVGALTALG